MLKNTRKVVFKKQEKHRRGAASRIAMARCVEIDVGRRAIGKSNGLNSQSNSRTVTLLAVMN